MTFRIVCEEPDDRNLEETVEETKKVSKTDDAEELNEWYRQNIEFLEQFDTNYPLNEYNVRKDEIGGLDAIVEKLERFRMGVVYQPLYELLGSSPSNGFILHGPPGTGKTYIAKYLSDSIGARFVDVSLDMFESKWVGQAAENLQRHLKNMRNYHKVTGEKVLVFFDEAEETFKSRAMGGWHGPRVNVLLREMDGLGESSGLIFGAATNHLDRVDPAILRAGRLDYIIEMPEYNTERLADVFLATARRYNRKSIVAIEELAEVSIPKGFLPYRISDEDASLLAGIASTKRLKPSDVNEVFRLTAETIIEEFVRETDEPFIVNDSIISRNDLVKTIEEYDRGESTNNIGF